MVLLDPATDTILQLEVVQDHLDHQAAQIIILLRLEDTLLLPMALVHQGHEARPGLPNNRDSWDPQEGLRTGQPHHLHRALMKCTTGLDGLSQATEVHVPHSQVRLL